MASQLSSVEVQTTRFDPVEAELGVTAVVSAPAQDLELRGRLMGPRCVYTETIEVAYPLKPLPAEGDVPGDVLRARVVVPEASPWSPKTPFRYEGPVELWQGGVKVEETRVVHCLRHVVLRRRGLFLNGQAIPLRGVQRNQIDERAARDLHAGDCNLLLARIDGSSEPRALAELADLAERFGFLLLGQLDGSEETACWSAETALVRRSACLGWLLPQSLLATPQVWHSAMSLLHGQRRDLFVGLHVQELPLPVLPGHISFLAGDEQLLEQLGDLTLPKLILLRRGQANPERLSDPATARVLGWVQRGR